MNTINKDNIQSLLTPAHIDMSQLPAPKVVEELSFEQIFQEMLSDFKSRCPNYDALLESDPAIVILECAAYREVLLRQRINECAKANMLAYATGTDLDNLAAFYGLVRLDGEIDERLRYRSQLALEALTTAGSEKAYLFHTLSADTRIQSASVLSPTPGQILISLLSTENNGIASQDLIDIVSKYVSSEDKRPLTDQVKVQSASLVEYEIKAKVYIYVNPSMAITEQECRNSLNIYVTKHSSIGNLIAQSGIYDALHTEGVQKVELLSPVSDVVTNKQQAPICTNIALEFINIDDTE